MEPALSLNVIASEIGTRDSEQPPARWQKVLANAIRDSDELCDFLELPDSYREPARTAARLFPLIVPRPFANLMEKGNPQDPLLRQVLPLDAELAETDLPRDAVGDIPAVRASGLLHKYRGRALLVLTGACAVNCRFCFRRHFPYGESPKGLSAWEPALEELAGDSTIEEVILSGGDPLAISDVWLEQLAKRLEQIEHLKRLRIHTRFPVVIPERISERLLTWLTSIRLQPVLVLHINHPRELTPALTAGVRELLAAGMLVLNQSVLLAGVNDDVATLQELSERLLETRILPYYLHQLDRVQGVTHFEVAESAGRALIESLRQRLPGYAIPRYVREVPGMPGKTVLV